MSSNLATYVLKMRRPAAPYELLIWFPATQHTVHNAANRAARFYLGFAETGPYSLQLSKQEHFNAMFHINLN